MNYIDKFKSFKVFESDNMGEKRIRSERLLNQAQVEYGIVKNENSSIEPSILFTDVVDSSKKWSQDPVEMMSQLEYHHTLVDSISEKYDGWIVKTIGDAFMIYFEPSSSSLENAIGCAYEIIKSESKYDLRCGICRGSVDEKTYKIQKVDLRDFFGNSVNVAARMESKVCGKPNTIAFSSTSEISDTTMSNIRRIVGKIEEVDLKKFDLRGATIKRAFKINVK